MALSKHVVALSAVALAVFVRSPVEGAEARIDGPDMPALVDTDESRGVAVFRRRDGSLLILHVGDHDADSGVRLDMVGASTVIIEHTGDDVASQRSPWRLRMEREADGGRITRTTDRPPAETTRPMETWRIEAMTPGRVVPRTENEE